MQKNIKSIFFVAVLFTLLFAVTAVSAADVSNDTTSLDNSASNLNIDKTVTNDNGVTDTIAKDSKNIKTTYQDHQVNDDDFDNLFDSDGKLTSSVNDGDTITLTSDVTRIDKSYIINKAVNLTSTNNYTINLNTINGYNLPTTNPTSFNFVAGAANSNVTNIHFHNTQVYINTTSNIIFDHINVTNEDQGVGKSVGVFSIRDGSTNITVKNSYFLTKDNTGCSNLVLAYANDCTIENNTIIGIGHVGNLLYTTTYNTAGVNYMDTSVNQNNYFHNNRIYAYNITGGVCIAVVVSGHSNTYEGNNVSSTSAFSGQWVSPTATYVGDFSEAYEGNTYLNNDINGSFTGTKNSTITGNTFHSSVSLPERCIFKNNNAENSTVTVTGKNCYLCNNTINHLIVNKAATDTLLCEDYVYLINTITDTYGNIVYVSHPDSLISNDLDSLLNKKVIRQVKSEGEVVIIDITNENIAEYFGSSDTNLNFNFQKTRALSEKNIIINILYLPQNVAQIRMNGGNTKNISVDFKDKTLENVYVDLRSVNIANLTLYYDTDYERPGYVCILGKESDNITINIDKEYNAEEMMALMFLRQNTLKNSNINAKVPSTSEGYKLIECVMTANLINNNITIQEKYAYGENPSLIAIGPRDEDGMDNVIIENNTINMIGTEEDGQLYAIKSNPATNVQIKNNNITVTTTGTATAVELNGNNSTVTDNYIVANDKLGDDAVLVTGEDNVVENNTGKAGAAADTRIATSIELDNNDNPIDVGQRLIISGVFKADNVESEASGIKVYDNDELIATIGSDEFGTITYAYTPTVSGSHNITFAFEGNDTHKNTSTTITVEVNEVIEPAKEYSLKVDTTEFTQKNPATITASIYYGNENEQEIVANISKGKVTFKVDGKTLKDANGKVIYAKIVNGTATIADYEVPATWKENSTIQAVYSGSTEVAKMSSEKTNITITQEELTLTTEDKQATVNSTITLTATLSDNTINTGKIVFKINGKTVKDANGKVIYAKVVNGTVSVEYTIPENMKSGNYNITATYVPTSGDKLEDVKTLNIA